MNESSDLPPDVLEALHGGRKIEAIKLLCERRGLSLKEAKEIVDRYAGEHPERIQSPERTSLSSGGSGWLGLALLVVVALIGYGLGSFFGLW